MEIEFHCLLIIDENGNPKMVAASINEQEVREAALPYKENREQYRPMIGSMIIDGVRADFQSMPEEVD